MSHLYRRAGFGATREELEKAVDCGYEATVDDLLHPEAHPPLDLSLFDRYFPDGIDGWRILVAAQARLMFGMLTTPRPLEEKMVLFWHYLFATGNAKLEHPAQITAQLDTFRRNCLGSFATILLELSKDPAMIFWLDNQRNTNDVHNENFGRELLELFAMGIGTYTENDVKSCARAFTGWTLRNPDLLQTQPYGHYLWEFEFRADEHDGGEKQFLGVSGALDGSDVIDIIVRQPATARFIATRLYTFFVDDEQDEQAIGQLAQVFQDFGGDIRTVMRALLLSDAFKSRAAYFAKVRVPVELVIGLLRAVGGYEEPGIWWGEPAGAARRMGQDLLNPPSVEGWHTGQEWIDSGLLLERSQLCSSLRQ